MIPGTNLRLLAPASGGYVIEGSGLFDQAAGTNLTRTPSSAGNSKTFRIDTIVKFGNIAAHNTLVSAGGSNYFKIDVLTSGKVNVEQYSGSMNFKLETTQLLRDFGAYYQISFVYDSTPSTPGATNVYIEINGTRVTALTTATYPSQNTDCFWNSEVEHVIGDLKSYSPYELGSYLARVISIDGSTSEIAAEVTTDGFLQFNDASDLTFGTNGFLIEGGVNVAAGYDSSLVATADRPTTTVSASSSQYTGAIGTSTFLADDLTVASNSSVRVNDTFTGDFSISFDGYNGGSGIGRTLLYPSSEDSTYNSAVQPGANYGSFSGNQFLIDHNDGSYYSNGASLTASLGATYGVRVTVTRKGSVLSIYYDGAFKAVFANGYSGTLRLVHGGAQATATINTVNWTDWSATGLPNDYTKAGTITATKDSPTDDAENDYGNYALIRDAGNYVATISEKSLRSTGTVGVQACAAISTIPFDVEDTEGFYVESQWLVGNALGANFNSIGIVQSNGTIEATAGYIRTASSVSYQEDGQVRKFLSTVQNYATWGANTGHRPVLFVKGGKIWFGLDKAAGSVTWNGDPSAGTGEAASGLTGLYNFVAYHYASGASMRFNFGSDAFLYTPPTGGKSIHTGKLPVPAVANYEDQYYIEAGISHSNGSTTAVTIPFDLDATGAMVRIKRTDSTGDWYVLDTVRGDLPHVKWNDRSFAEANFSDGGFSGTTFNISSDFATGTYLLEAFKIGSYFQIKTFTGTGSAHAETFPSALDTAPGMMWIKYRTDTSNDQLIYHESLGNTKYLHSNSNSVALTSTTIWNDTSPTTTQFTVGTNGAVNTNGGTYLFYAWANSGPYAFGDYIGNGNANGTFINVGGRPQVFVGKPTTAADSYVAKYEALLGYNVNGERLFMQSTNAKSTSTTDGLVDFVSNGVKNRISSTGLNSSTYGNYVYFAFGIQPIQGNGKDTSQGRAK